MEITPELITLFKDNLKPVLIFVFIGFLCWLLREELRGWVKTWGPFRFKTKNVDVSVDTISTDQKELSQEKPASEKELLKNDEKEKYEEKMPQNSNEALVDLIIALSYEKPKDETKIEKAYLKFQELEKDTIKKLEGEALYYRLRFGNLNDQSALDHLRAMTQNKLVASTAYLNIGICMEGSNYLEVAIKEFEKAVLEAKSEKDKIVAIGRIANCLFRLDRKPDAYRLIEETIADVNSPENLEKLYEELGSLYEKESNHEFRALALLKALENRPNNPKTIFGIAYSFSEIKLNELSLAYYKIAEKFNADDGALINNIGVAYDRLDMPLNSVETYKKAVGLKETLSAANLAYRYMNAGFEEEARHTLDSVKTEKELHPNIGSAIADLANKKEEESKQYQKVESTALKEQTFFDKFATQYFEGVKEMPRLQGQWEGKNIQAEINQKESLIEIKLTKNDQQIRAIGEMHNRAAKVISYALLNQRSLSGEIIEQRSVPDKDGYLYFDDNKNEINIMLLKRSDKELEFITLQKC